MRPLGFFPADGNQWVELDSTCSVPINEGSNGGNIALYQDLTLAAGHIYEVIFEYKAKQPHDSLQKISVKFGGETVLVKEVTETDWTTYKFTRAVSTDAIRIEFEELGKDDGKGTMLDNVRIYDLGVAPY